MDDLVVKAAEIYAQRKARETLEGFTRYTYPEFIWDWFPSLLCRILEDFFDELIMGQSPQYMIFAPPRSGKTELVSRRFPAWVRGIAPNLSFMDCSYGADLSDEISRDVQAIIDTDEYRRVFPDTLLPTRKSGGVNTAKFWNVIDRKNVLHKGGYISAGVEGAITGRGCHIGIIDDPVKDYAEAASKVRQEAIWKWYETTFKTRRDPMMSGTLIIQTRWHRHDLSGKLLDEMSRGNDNWTVFSFPMECEEEIEVVKVGGKTYRTRALGDLLFPARMSQKFVNSYKQSPLTWAALYQQRPTIDGGNFFKSEWWDFYDKMPDPFERMIITADTAQKKGEEHDYSIFQIWGRKEGRVYLVDQVRGKWDATELRQQAKAIWNEWGGGIRGPRVRASSMFVEDKSSGTGLIQDLRKDGIPIVGIPRTKDKVTRAVDKQARFAAGLVVLPRYKPWLNEFLMEFEDFNLLMTHANDDQVDAALDAVDILLDGGGGLDYSAA